MATNTKDGKAANSPKGTHGGNRAGDHRRAGDERKNDQGKKEDVKRSSQAAGKDPHRGSR